MPGAARQRLFAVLQGDPQDRWSRAFQAFILTLIFANVVAVMAETVQSLAARYSRAFEVFELVSVAIFTVEYLLRLWTCVEDNSYRRPLAGRLRFAASPLALVDLLAILPFYVPLVMRLDLRVLRAIRLIRLFRVLKAVRYVAAANAICAVLNDKKEELVVALTVVVSLLVFAASVMYYVEREAQPETFSSIPAAMWWAVITMTTVGYGDIYPITPAGKVCAALIALLSIGLFALPAGILASGFAQALHTGTRGTRTCPHCGREIGE